MIMLTPITTPKNASSMKSTLAPVNGFGETDGLFMRNPSAILRRNEIIGRRCNLTQPDIGHPEIHRDGFLGVVLGRRGYQKPQFRGLIPRPDRPPPRSARGGSLG